eukprot:634744-Prorocentrum_minimum.AAC.1
MVRILRSSAAWASGSSASPPPPPPPNSPLAESRARITYIVAPRGAGEGGARLPEGVEGVSMTIMPTARRWTSSSGS